MTQDPTFPYLHGRPARGWVNDPNGCAYVDGRYHLFFQYNPDAPVHDRIAWGHLSFPNLVDWTQEQIALVARPGGVDEHGCWTGCLTMDEGVPTAAYSAAAPGGRSQVVLARGDRDLRHWEQSETVVAGMPEDAGITQVRDPYLFTYAGRRYAVQGAGHLDGSPRVLMYDASDLSNWRELGELFPNTDPIAAAVAPAHVWECPSLFPLGDRWVLVVSLWRWPNDAQELAGVRYLTGDLTPDADGHPRFRPTSGGELDTGPCFYAPQVLTAAGRCLLWAWSWELDRSEDDVRRAGWAGALTWARELALDGERVVSRPVPELTALRRAELELAPGATVTSPAFEVELPDDAGDVEIWLEDAGPSRLVAKWPAPQRRVQPTRVLVDGSLVEAFPGGAESHTTRAYPGPGARWRILTGGHTPARLWQLGRS